MNKEFSNIIIFNNESIDFIIDKLEKMILDLDYIKCEEKEANIKIDIIQDNINNICVISSDYFKFTDLATNKSIIRKIAKRVAQDTFMVTARNNIAVIEKYSFNKREYDYISLGDVQVLEELGYNESYAKYMQSIVWSNHFVGRNNISSLDKILKEKDTYFENYEILIEIMKLYGIKTELTTYKLKDTILNYEIIKKEIYFK